MELSLLSREPIKSSLIRKPDSSEMFPCTVLLFVMLMVTDSQAMHLRIVNGIDAEPGEFPFAALVRYNDDNGPVCGSTILNKNFVLTSADCVYCDIGAFATNFNIQYGLVNVTNDNTNQINVKNIYCNDYTIINAGDGYYDSLYDTAILELVTPLPDDGSWKPGNLSRVFNSAVEQDGVILGWGRINANYDETSTLKKYSVKVFNDSVCGELYEPDHHLCLGSTGNLGGTCFGDSGTALVVDGLIAGQASFATNTTCGVAYEKQPMVYARIEKYFDWIKSITDDVFSN